MSRWWRAYDEAVDDPKLCLLSDRLHRVWFNLCCITSQNDGTLPAIDAIAFKLRMTPAKAQSAICELRAAGLVDEDGNGKSAPHNWKGRQFQSDVSTERVKRFRQRAGNVSATVSETPPETEADTKTDSETDKIQKEARKRASRIPENWMPSPEGGQFALSHGLSEAEANTELEKFTNYWTAKGGHGAAKLDWDATWRNWILTAAERKGKPNGQHGKPSLSDVANNLADDARRREHAAGIGRPTVAIGGS